ncbi:MAG TPA: phycobilisome rod-core linker polypeptide [Leptolyngbyaceae cyanobacterium M33_DOE_097]|uniref:Phycobilisome rod-core linker polypeptide CpcG2 n=1 Tax=Oscillatoriales cyanobacterium SpSt-418 TaxID=2282169 RepID=A0A7C3KCN4_9CYAN|nr:phycobilisome rod-core linker polypeptide [Leptolyngbyaceae cyanobacterium M33_DOE_097]
MTLPILEYSPKTQDQRVRSFGVAEQNEDTPYIYRVEAATSVDEMDALIWAAYRQVFNEQETIRFNRQITLETQLKNQTIRVRDFIRGLAKSERFYRLVVEPNSNYRLVEIAFKRLLGRAPYSRDEEIAWSVQIATLGWSGFVDALIDSEEYTRWFGDNTVPYQRKRKTERPYSFTPRYGSDYRDKLPRQGYRPTERFEPLFAQFEPFSWEKLQQRSDWSTVSGLAVAGLGVIALFLAIASLAG